MALLPSICWAAGSLTSLSVSDDIAYFATSEAKLASSPSCMDAENSDKWTVSLNSSTGKAIYALLVTAMAEGRNVNVTTSNDCGDTLGFERAQEVEVLAASSAITTGVSDLYLYKSDGVTKIGKIVDVLTSERFLYLPENTLGLKTLPEYRPHSGTSAIYFKTSNCTGNTYTSTPNFAGKNDLYSNTSFFKSGSTQAATGYSSILNGNGCQGNTNASKKLYELDFSYEDPTCGQQYCLINKG